MKKFYRILLIIGVAVGVFCSICVFTAGQTQWTAMRLKKMAIESNIYKIVKSPEPSSVRGMGLDEARRICGLLPGEVRSDFIAASFHYTVISYEGEPLPVRAVMGTGANFAEVAGLQIIEGRYLLPGDIDNCEKVCVLKSNIYELISARQAGHIEINGEPYKIIGIVSGDTGETVYRSTYEVIVPVTAFYSHIEKTVEQSGLISQIILDRKDYSKDKLLDIMQENAKAEGLDISDYKLMPYYDDVWDDNL